MFIPELRVAFCASQMQDERRIHRSVSVVAGPGLEGSEPLTFRASALTTELPVLHALCTSLSFVVKIIVKMISEI